MRQAKAKGLVVGKCRGNDITHGKFFAKGRTRRRGILTEFHYDLSSAIECIIDVAYERGKEAAFAEIKRALDAAKNG